METYIQTIKDNLVRGYEFKDIYDHLQFQSQGIGKSALKLLLKHEKFEDQCFQELWKNIERIHPFETLKRTSKIYQLYQVQSAKPSNKFIESFLNHCTIQSDYLHYFDILVQSEELAKRILDKCEIDLSQIQIKPYGLLSWQILVQQHINDISQLTPAIQNWISHVYIKNPDLALQKAQFYIEDLTSRLLGQQIQQPPESVEFQKKLIGNHLKGVRSVCISKNSKFVVSSGDDCVIRYWDLVNQWKSKIIGELDKPIRTVCIFNHEEFVITGGDDCAIRLWNINQTQKSIKIGQHDDIVRSVSISSNGRFVISGSNDKTIRYWDLQETQNHRIIGTHEGWVQSIILSEKFIVSASADKTVRIWNLITNENHIIGQHEKAVMAIALSQSNSFIVSGGNDNAIRFWDLSSNNQNRLLGKHQQCVWDVCISNNQQFVISGSRDQNIMMWDLLGSYKNRIIGQHESSVVSLCISECDQLLVTCEGLAENMMGKIFVWRL